MPQNSKHMNQNDALYVFFGLFFFANRFMYVISFFEIWILHTWVFARGRKPSKTVNYKNDTNIIQT